MSGTSEQSPTSSTTVPVRHRKGARKPRPVSTIACFPDSKSVSSQSSSLKSPITPTTPSPSSAIVIRANRARSTGSLNRQPIESKTCDNQVKPVPPTKPAHVKAAAAARKMVKIQQKGVNKSNSNTTLSNNSNNKSGSNGSSEINKSITCERRITQKTSSSSPSISSTNHKKANNINLTENNNGDVNKSKMYNNYGNESNSNGVKSETSLNQGHGNTSGSSNSNKNISEEEYKRKLAEKRRVNIFFLSSFCIHSFLTYS